jgi:hypothetical protein
MTAGVALLNQYPSQIFSDLEATQARPTSIFSGLYAMVRLPRSIGLKWAVLRSRGALAPRLRPFLAHLCK